MTPSPLFRWAVANDLLYLLGLGAGFALVDSTSVLLSRLDAVIPVRTFGWLLIVTGVALLVGWLRSDRLFRWALSVGAGASFFFAYSIGAEALTRLWRGEPVPIAGSSAAYGFVAVSFLIQASVPRGAPVRKDVGDARS